MIKNGVEIFRVEDSVFRICRLRGFYYVNIFIIFIVIIILDEKFDGFLFMKMI